MSGPRIAFFDIETAPSLGYYFDLYKEGNIVATHTPWFMLSYAYKWSDEKAIHVKALCDYPGYDKRKQDDTKLVTDLWKLFDEADVLIAHNGDRFDIRKTNSRFLKIGLTPPSPSKSIDTLKIARRHFKLDSNRLSALGEYLGLGGKLPTTGWDTWRGCIEGDLDSWRIMKRYNKRDVSLLEQVYHKLAPWASSHPDFRIYTGQAGCPSCLSFNVQQRGYHILRNRRASRLQCKDCGKWFSGKVAS